MFSLIQHHGWDAKWIESLVPWEKFIYVDQLKNYLKAENEKARDQAIANKRK